MTGAGSRPRLVAEAIVADEIGIETGVYGNYRVRAAYRPVFRREGGFLICAAIQASTTVEWSCLPVASAGFSASLPPHDLSFLDALSRTVQLRNYCHIGVPEHDLLIACQPRPGTAADLLCEVAATGLGLTELSLTPRRVVCALIDTQQAGEETTKALADELRGIGFRIAVGSFGSAPAAPRLADILQPELVVIDGEWFRAVCRDVATVQLFGAAVSTLQRQGAKVLVQGIEDASQLRVALEAGSDWMEGPFLAWPVPAGAALEVGPVSIGARLGEPAKVIRLLG